MFKKVSFYLVIAVFLAGLLFVATPTRAEVVCTPTGYVRDGINLTAAYINPVGLTGEIDATGCHIGVYFDTDVVSAKLDGVEIYGANYFGVVVNGSAGSVHVDITNSSIHNIGEDPFNGAQHGIAIYYAGLDGYAVTGTVKSNDVYAYQKGGITVNGASADVTVRDNVVTGLGPVDFIAQNGIQFGWEARGEIFGNTVSGNEYTVCTGKGLASCAWISAGILLYDPDPTVWRGASLKTVNDLFDNQVDFYIYYDR
jgi:hypothetical protein